MTETNIATLIAEIETFRDKWGVGESTLGRRLMNDPWLVHELRNGRDVRLSTINRIRERLKALGEEYRVHGPGKRGRHTKLAA